MTHTLWRPHHARVLLTAVLLPTALLALSGCAGAPPQPTQAQPKAQPKPASQPTSLAGTRWLLASIQSMDNAQPTRRPADPARYMLAFGEDGRVSLRLDCNRGSGTWQVTPAKNDDPGRVSGGLALGPLAVTRAMCPPDSLAPQIEKAWPLVRSYLIKDGQLHLSLMADGGIYSWTPAP